MKPINTRKPYLLPDNEPTRCCFMAWQGMPIGYEECEAEATVKLPKESVVDLGKWFVSNPKAIFHIYTGHGFPVYVCDTHERLLISIGAIYNV